MEAHAFKKSEKGSWACERARQPSGLTQNQDLSGKFRGRSRKFEAKEITLGPCCGIGDFFGLNAV